MSWFKRQATQSSAPDTDARPAADAQALLKIHNRCAVAAPSAESVAHSAYEDLSKAEKQRFESAKRMSLVLAKNITDASYRADALHRIIELCMNANDEGTARILVRGIQSELIREKLLEDYPVIFY